VPYFFDSSSLTRSPQARRRAPVAGFTLIELMITVAIVAILSAVAVPAYRDYIVRSRLADATNALTSLRARMEQYYQDNRTYKDVGKIQSPCATSSTLGTFAIDCVSLEDTRYQLRATGSGMTTNFIYILDHNGNQFTKGLPPDWGSVPNGGYTCWVMKKGGTC
jgi:type IV pilus assembly protein PilE